MGAGVNYPQAVLLDYGNTLATADRYDLSAGCERLSQMLWPRRSAKDQQRLERLAIDLDAETVRLREATPVEFTGRSFLRLLLAQVPLHSALPIGQLEAEFWKATFHYRPEPGAAEALADLRSRGVRLGVVSNCAFSADVLAIDLDRMGFSEYLDIVISSADYGVRKQHPLLFSAALALLRLAPSEVWFVGDSLEYDIAPARSHGMGTVWYNRKGGPAPGVAPDAVIVAWSDLPWLLRAASPGR